MVEAAKGRKVCPVEILPELHLSDYAGIAINAEVTVSSKTVNYLTPNKITHIFSCIENEFATKTAAKTHY